MSTHGSRRTLRLLGALVGLMLIGAAVVAIVTRQDAARGLIGNAANAPAWMFVALIGAVAITPILTATNFWILTRRYGTVHPSEMGALIAAAWLLNYLPLWPGMVSRVTYHRVVNRIAVKDSAKVILEAGALSGIAAALLVILLLTVAAPLGWAGWGGAGIGASGAFVCCLLAFVMHRSTRWPHAWRYLAVVSVRTVELGVWALRFALSAAILGEPVSPVAALTVASLVQIALLVPIAPNGLGVREWAVGFAAGVFAMGMTTQTGLGIALLDRGAEVLVAVPLGLIGALWIARRRRALGVNDSADADSS